MTDRRGNRPVPDDEYDDYEEGGGGPLPVHDIEAERWCLGGCMRSRGALNEVAELLVPDDFLRPAHGMIYEAMIVLFAQGIPVDPVTLNAELHRRNQVGVTGGPMYLAGMYGDAVAVTAPAAVAHAEVVRECAARRHVGEIGSRLVQGARERHTDLAELVTGAQADVGRAVATAAAARSHLSQVMTVDRFFALDTTRLGPVIPGLLDHQDRVLVCGYEGDGKTTLAYQVAVAAAAGVHPFAWSAIPPVRVMIMDFENPTHLMQRKLQRLVDVAARSPRWTPENLYLASMPGGTDVTKPADVMRLADMIRLAQPDLIIAGPIYKMFLDRGQGAEELHSQVTGFWDMIRERYGPAMWLETHPPGSAAGGARLLRPAGSAIYMRWPEFGFGLARGKRGTLKIQRFRGDREEGRPWPVSITRNGTPGGWPWAATYDNGMFLDEPAAIEQGAGAYAAAAG
jgi:replicative DNA helicase